MLRAVALSAGGNSNEAAGVLTGLINAAPGPDLLLLRGDAYLTSGKVKEAKSDFMAAESMKQGSGLYGLARCAAAGGETKAAVSYLEAHLKSQFRKSEPEIMLDKSFGSIHASPEWKSLWKKDWYRGYERKSWEIDHYIKIGKTDLAGDVYRELSAVYPDMPVTDYCNCLLYTSRGLYRDAAALLTPLTIKPDAPPSYLTALAEAQAGEGSFYAAAMA